MLLCVPLGFERWKLTDCHVSGWAVGAVVVLSVRAGLVNKPTACRRSNGCQVSTRPSQACCAGAAVHVAADGLRILSSHSPVPTALSLSTELESAKPFLV